jgi:hypothetical protein
MHGPRDVRLEGRDDPTISSRPTRSSGYRPRVSAAPTCGPTGASRPLRGPAPMGHEYVGIVEELRQRRPHDRARSVRGRLVLGLGQYVRDLPGRLPELVHQPGAHGRHW